jgi:uncharacterized protein YjcR
MKDPRIKNKCKNLYLNRYTLEQILKLVPGVSKKTLYNWKQKDKWDEERKANLSDDEKINNRLSGVVLKLIEKVNQSPDKQSLANLESAVKIYDDHRNTLLIKLKR